MTKVWSEQAPTGAHRSRRMPFPEWVPSEVMRHAERLSISEAEQILSPWPVLGGCERRVVGEWDPRVAHHGTG